MDLILGATTDLAVWQLTLMAVISLVVGLSGGVVGIALGVIRLPMLTFFGVDPLIAAGTNLMISVMGSAIGTLEAFLEHRVVMSVVLAMGGPAFVGAFIGGYFADVVPVWILLTVVTLLMGWSALFLIAWSVRIMRIRRRYPSARTRRAITGVGMDELKLDTKQVSREGIAGFAIGLIGGAVGLVLGVLRMPALLAMHIDPHKAAGTNLAITVLVGISGFVGHLLKGSVDWHLIAIVGIPGVIGMYAGHPTRESIRRGRTQARGRHRRPDCGTRGAYWRVPQRKLTANRFNAEAGSMRNNLHKAMAQELPLQIVGVINAYAAIQAEKAGFKAIYLSGSGIATASYGLPDLGMTGLTDVLADVERVQISLRPTASRRLRYRLGRGTLNRAYDSRDGACRRSRDTHRGPSARKTMWPLARQNGRRNRRDVRSDQSRGRREDRRRFHSHGSGPMPWRPKDCGTLWIDVRHTLNRVQARSLPRR